MTCYATQLTRITILSSFNSRSAPSTKPLKMKLDKLGKELRVNCSNRLAFGHNFLVPGQSRHAKY
jgi:hypothetical protein